MFPSDALRLLKGGPVALLAAAGTAAILAQPTTATAQDADGNILLEASELPWRDLANGARIASLFGTPSAEGEPYSFRLFLPDGYESQPHTHTVAEHMTVLSGKFFVGIGETFDRDAAVEYGPGSYVVIGPNVAAYMFSVGETEVQIHGIGPLITVPVRSGGG